MCLMYWKEFEVYYDDRSAVKIDQGLCFTLCVGVVCGCLRMCVVGVV